MEPKQKTNLIQLIGNIGKDPEVKYFPSGACKVTASLAVTRKVKEEKVADWFNLEAWGDVAEGMAEQVKRGMRVGITNGQMINDTWTDKEGKKRDGWKVKVYDWKLMPFPGDEAPKQAADDFDSEVPF